VEWDGQGESRDLGLSGVLLLVGDFRKAPGSRRRILANVYRFDYVDQNGSILASIEKPPAKASVVSEAEVVGKTQAKILELAHLPPLGSDWPTLRQTLSGNYWKGRRNCPASAE